LNGIEEKEVEYVTYEYDSNYNMLPITKTKMEKVPEFMLLSSTTESNSLLKSTINYLESKKLLEKKSGYYKIVSYPGISIDLYLMIKNNILFLGSSESQFESIIKGSYVPKVSDEIAKMISGNQTYMYVGLSKFESLFRNSNTEISEKGNRSVELIKKSPDFYFVTGKPKKNISSNKLIITTPQGYKNGLDYLVQLLGELN
ncbi:MAG: hypothetical protein OEY34_05190, partial [Cyclobacteriaceae bacterium]|nr:hypothetical protein [Cyclobacteriaceae bacterium]